jgi:hypothetical protein
LCVGYPVSVHEAPDPDDKGYDGELPRVNKWYGNKLECTYNAQYHTLRTVLEKLKRGSFVFYKGLFNVEQEKRSQAQQNE